MKIEERDAWTRALEHQQRTISEMVELNAALAAVVAECVPAILVRTYLIAYGRHQDWCLIFSSGTMCTCGFATALAQATDAAGTIQPYAFAPELLKQLAATTNRLETIRETHPDIALDRDIAAARAVLAIAGKETNGDA